MQPEKNLYRVENVNRRNCRVLVSPYLIISPVNISVLLLSSPVLLNLYQTNLYPTFYPTFVQLFIQPLSYSLSNLFPTFIQTLSNLYPFFVQPLPKVLESSPKCVHKLNRLILSSPENFNESSLIEQRKA